jgi:hypothetical protein
MARVDPETLRKVERAACVSADSLAAVEAVLPAGRVLASSVATPDHGK